MAGITLEQRRGIYFQKLGEGAVIDGIVIEIPSEGFAIVEIDGFLIRCKDEKHLKVGSRIKLKIEKLDWENESIVLKALN